MASYRPWVPPLVIASDGDPTRRLLQSLNLSQEQSSDSGDSDFTEVDPGPVNTLTCTPRIPPFQDQPFDEDGPGVFSDGGVRHDNDRSEVKDIKIFPTVDEVSMLPLLLF